MNRALIFGIALFLAVVGIALMTVDTTAEAGHRCRCKCSQNDCCAPSCCAPSCCAPANCCPTACPPACCGCAGGVHAAPAPAPAAAAVPARAQFGFRTVSFQR